MRVKAARMPEPSLVIETCAECRQDLEHCHGAAIRHWDGWGDCSDDPGCRLAPEQHQFVISCREVQCDCEPGPHSAGWERADWEQANWPPEHAAAS
jgi:hypothetical protein